MGRALVLVDIQNDFCEGGSMGVEGGGAVAAKAAERVLADRSGDAAGRGYDAIVLTADWHHDPGGHWATTGEPDFSTSWPVHCAADTHGADFHPSLHPAFDHVDEVFRKGMHAAAYSGFEGVASRDGRTGLGDWLRGRGITELEVGGIATDYCVRATVLDALREGFSVRLLVDTISGVAPESTQTALAEMTDAGAVVWAAPMPTTETRQPAHRSLFISLVNDAGLFPPAMLSMDDALRGHARHREAPYSDLVGPFLVGVPAVPDLVAALAAGAPPPPTVGLVARPGTAAEDTDAALGALRELGGTRVVSLDTAWSPAWRNLDIGDLTVHLEVGREGHDEALDDIASAADFVDVRAKFRTGPTPDRTWPDAEELADFIIGAGQRHVPFTLTGGLHHVVRGEHDIDGRREEQHGLLNVLVAVHASAGGADDRTARDLLEVREADALADIVRGWSGPDVAAVRSAFVGYGCCDVTDPIGELSDLGLVASP